VDQALDDLFGRPGAQGQGVVLAQVLHVAHFEVGSLGDAEAPNGLRARPHFSALEW